MLKYLIFSVLIMLLLPYVAKAQALQQGDQLITVGLGIASIPHKDYESKPPSFTLSYQRGIAEKIGGGYVSVGALVSFASSLHQYYNNDLEYQKNYNYSTFAAKGNYHIDMVELTDNVMWNSIDLYAGAVLGFTYEVASNNNDFNKDKHYYLATDIFIGGRYNFYENIGAFVEVGYGIAYLKGGISIQF